MTLQPQSHLSAEAFDDVLIGLGSQESLAHLEDCAVCREKLKQFQDGVQLFNAASMAWTRARVSKIPNVPRSRTSFVPSSVLSLCAAAMLFVVIGLPAVFHLNHRTAPSTSTGLDARDSAEQIAQDNQLMRDVDAAINPDEATIVDQYHLVESHKLH